MVKPTTTMTVIAAAMLEENVLGIALSGGAGINGSVIYFSRLETNCARWYGASCAGLQQGGWLDRQVAD